MSNFNLLAIDPGCTESAWLIYDADAGRPLKFGKVDNAGLLQYLHGLPRFPDESADRVHHLAIEMVASYGMPVGREIFETVLWTGRFVEAWNRPFTLAYRRDVKLHLCGSARAKDSNIRCSLIDRFGPGKEKAIGKKKSPGPLHGITGDMLAALAVAVTWCDVTLKKKETA